jgi:CRP-like cAMP-binding protein
MNRPNARPAPVSALHRLFASVAVERQASLAGELRRFEQGRGARLIEAGTTPATVFFIVDGLVALLGRGGGGEAAETGLVGPGGLVGHAALLGSAAAGSSAIALTGLRGVAIEARALRHALEDDPPLRRELTAYAAERLAETEALCVCGALHSVEQRLASWLTRAAALLGPDRPIELTHQQLADLFGVRRASVTTSLHMMEGEQSVRCRRGRIEIRDLARLEGHSCGCRRAS